MCLRSYASPSRRVSQEYNLQGVLDLAALAAIAAGVVTPPGAHETR
jgi:hypothetical protein